MLAGGAGGRGGSSVRGDRSENEQYGDAQRGEAWIQSDLWFERGMDEGSFLEIGKVFEEQIIKKKRSLVLEFGKSHIDGCSIRPHSRGGRVTLENRGTDC